MENVRNVKLPPGPAAGKLAKVLLIGGAAVYGLTQSLFNVEGGHRAILFNRIGGISDTVRRGRQGDMVTWGGMQGARGRGVGLAGAPRSGWASPWRPGAPCRCTRKVPT